MEIVRPGGLLGPNEMGENGCGVLILRRLRRDQWFLHTRVSCAKTPSSRKDALIVRFKRPSADFACRT